MLCVLSVALLLFSPFLFKMWVGNNIHVPFSLSVAMTLYIMGTCWMMIHCMLVNGISKLKVQFYLYLISTVINIPISIFLGRTIGLLGVLLSNLFVVLLMDIVLYVQCKKILNGTATGIWNA
jgi:predicted metal-binding membrane protein